MDEPRVQAGEKALDRMLLTLAERGFVTLDPPAATRRTRGEEGSSSPPTDRCRRLSGGPGHADAGAGQAAGLPQHPSAVRRLPARPARHRRPRRAHPGAGERAGDAAAAAALRARAAARRAAAGPAGHDPPRRRADPPRPDRSPPSRRRRTRKRTTTKRRNVRRRWPTSCGCCSTPCIPTWPTSRPSRSGRPASCCASTATSICTSGRATW